MYKLLGSDNARFNVTVHILEKNSIYDGVCFKDGERFKDSER